MPASRSGPAPPAFLTNQARVLAAIAADPAARQRDLAVRVGLTDRGLTRIIAELVDAGYVTVRRLGRRNRYAVHPRAALPDAAWAHRTVGELLAFLLVTAPLV